MNAIQKQKLRRFVKELEAYRGRHTELVSVYVPAGYELVKIIQHINKVSSLLKRVARTLESRADTHDVTKFEPDEFTGFCQLDSYRQHEKEEYGSKTYEAGMNTDAVKLHLSRNSHHLEYWPNGLTDMSFADVIEMLVDWEIARQQRDTEQDINKTWKVRQERFKLSDFEIAFLRMTWEKMEKDL